MGTTRRYRPYANALTFPMPQDPADAMPVGNGTPHHCADCAWTGSGHLAAFDHERATGHVLQLGPRPNIRKESTHV